MKMHKMAGKSVRERRAGMVLGLRENWETFTAGRRARRDAVIEAEANGIRRGTRRRSALMMVGGFALLGTLYGAVSSSVMAVNFNSSNTAFNIYTDRVKGEYAAGYIAAQTTQDGANPGVAQVGFKTASLNGLCAIATEDLPGLLPVVSLVVTGGEPVDGTTTGAADINAEELYLSADLVTGTSADNIEKLTLGQDANTLVMGEGAGAITTHRGVPGGFGLQAKVLDVKDLRGQSYGVDLKGSINLPNLNIRVVPGEAGKSACVQ